MKKIILTLVAAVGFSAMSFAQEKHDAALDGNKIGVGAEFSMPNGNLGKIYPIGFGGSVNYIHALNQKLKLTGSAGFIGYLAKKQDNISKQDAMNVIPVKVGARYYLIDNVYLVGEVGTAFRTTSGSSTPFTYSPGIGVDFPVSDKMTVDLSGRYDGWVQKNGSQGFVGIRAALNFGL